jgi:hypothetical protein
MYICLIRDNINCIPYVIPVLGATCIILIGSIAYKDYVHEEDDDDKKQKVVSHHDQQIMPGTHINMMHFLPMSSTLLAFIISILSIVL